jgi:tetrahydromethanopterin S-methyltransferase subunit G
MTALTFDTHDFVKKLKGAGFSEEQAEVLTDLQKATSQNTLEQARHDYKLDDLATKRDLKEVELKIEMVKSELKREIADTKADLIKWVVGVVVGVALLQTTIIAGLIFRLADKV